MNEQSPVDLRTGDARWRADLPPLRLRYPSSVEVALRYITRDDPAEETVAALLPRDAAEVVLGGVRHALEQVHWHAPAEHLLDGRRLPLEQHLVHRAPEGQLLVLTVLLRAGPRNAALARLFSRLPERGTADHPVEELDLRALLPSGGRAFRYRGSLTTSPFTEGVQFVVYTAPLTLAASDLARFERRFPKGNAREVQDLAGRTPQLGPA